MTTYSIAPAIRQQFCDATGAPYAGGLLFCYNTNTDAKENTYTDSTGGTPNSNPIVLDSAGFTPYGIWLVDSTSVYFKLAPSTDTDPPIAPIFTTEDIVTYPVNSVGASEWITGTTATYIDADNFSVVGDQTDIYETNRRVKAVVTAGTIYGTISVSAYTTLTTVTVTWDSGGLDAGLSAVYYGIISATNTSNPNAGLTTLTVWQDKPVLPG